MTKGEPFFKEKFQVSGIIIVFWGKDMDYVMYSPVRWPFTVDLVF